jgi:RNA polymerase sigma-70 factor, ECF subfamily
MLVDHGGDLTGSLDDREEMVRANLPRLLRLCAVIVGDHQEAEDLVQEAFIKAFGSIRWFRRESSLATWLTRIAVNVCRDRLRARRRGREILEAEVPERRDPQPLAEEQLMAAQMARRALSVLSPKEEMVIRLRFGGEYGIPEIARTLRCSQSTVKTHLSRGMRKMARTLEGEHP